MPLLRLGFKASGFQYNKITEAKNQIARAIVRFQFFIPLLALVALSSCATTDDGHQSSAESVTSYRTGDIPFSYPKSLLTGHGSSECLKWSDSNILATDKVFLFNAAGIDEAEAATMASKIDGEIAKLSVSMDWASYKWLNSLPVINQPNGAAAFADALVSLDRAIGTARLESDEAMNSKGPEHHRDSPLFSAKITEKVEVLSYVLPRFSVVMDWRTPTDQVYRHFLKMSREDRVEAVRRYNRLSEFHVGSEQFEILPGRVLVCVQRESAPFAQAEGHDMGINLKVTASDVEIRRALVASYQAVRTRAYGDLDSLVPEWFLVGQQEFHAGGRVASAAEALYNSPIRWSGSSGRRPENYSAVSGFAYQYIGAANEMSLISSLLDAVRYRDMPIGVGATSGSEQVFKNAFDNRIRALDGGPLTIRSFDYGWNGFVGGFAKLAYR